jgi:putative NIF3 family GTP cyclohydrolase 1 type 2
MKARKDYKQSDLNKLRKAKHSLYVAHAPLDTHTKYGTSIALAKICGISFEKLFFDYFGAPTALFGRIQKTNFEKFANSVQENLSRPKLTLHKHQDYVEKIGVVAGGGDIVEILQEVYDNNCDTLLTGTIEHRWDLPFIQEGNKKFHELNKKLKINLVGGTHYGTERPAMISVNQLFKEYGVKSKFIEDDNLLLSE